MVSSEPTWHMSRAHKRVSKFVNFKVQKVQKPHMFDLGTHSPLLGDALWSFCHIAGLWAPLQNCFTVLHPCDGPQYVSSNVAVTYFKCIKSLRHIMYTLIATYCHSM